MAVLPPKGKTVDRRPSLRGKVMQDVSNGAERSRAWPRDRGKTLSPKTKEQMEWFRQAQWATKYMDPKMLVIFSEATKGTPLLPRDMATMMFAGRLFSFIFPDGRKVYSVQVLKDVSESLDVISQTPGDQLIRGDTYWEGLPRIVGNRAGVQLTRTGNLLFVSGSTPIVVPWTAEVIDQLAAWSIAAPNDIVCTEAGWYNVVFEGQKAATSQLGAQFAITVNNVEVARVVASVWHATLTCRAQVTALLNLQVGDIVRCTVLTYSNNQNFSLFRFSMVGNA